MGDAAATKSRILQAGTTEFARHGIAGARVDRVAANAEINKSQIYSYFGSKDKLFDAVFDARVAADVASVPLDTEDLPGYVTALYDVYLADPELVRLITWARMERTPSGALCGPVADHDAELEARIEYAQARGVLVDDIAALDLWSMLVALASTWAQSAIVFVADSTEDDAIHERRKAALAATAQRAFCVPSRIMTP